MLTEQLTADAAALHQAILRHGGEVSPFFCGKELGWEHRRIARAMEELVAAGIIDPAAAVPVSMEEYRREQLDILADGVRNSLDMDAVYRAMGMENPRGCKA